MTQKPANSIQKGADSEWEVLYAYWIECEQRVYPMVVSSPEGYMNTLRLVRGIADVLAGATDFDSLLQRWHNNDGIVAEVAKVRGISEADVADLGAAIDAVLGTGFAIRADEIKAYNAAVERRKRFFAARQEGLQWTMLQEQGDINSGLLDPYQCVELHLATGLTVITSTEADPSTLTPVYVVSVAELEDYEDRKVIVDAAQFTDRETRDAAEVAGLQSEMRQLVANAVPVLDM